jgi:signal transduction histidine kinase
MIRERLLWGFVLIALLPLLGVGVATSLVSYYNGRQQSVDRLESVAARKASAIQTWAESLQQELQGVSQTDYAPAFVSTAMRLANEGKQYAWYNSLVRKRLRALADKSSQFDELLLLDLRGRVVVSTDAAREGMSFGDRPEFQRGLAGPTTWLPFYPGGPDEPSGLAIADDPSTVGTAVPHKDGTGRLLGVIVGRSDVGPLFTVLEERTGLGETGKAYLVDGNHRLLAGTQFRQGNDEAPRSVSTSGLASTIRSAASSSGVYIGSTGASVIGSSRWLPDLQVALAVEQNLAEAQRAVFATLGIYVVIALAAVGIAVIASLLMTRSIADPIADLARTASQIATGQLDRVVVVEKADEIGALATAFNSMTAQLRDLINSLERRVGERTRALQGANAALERRAVQLETSARVGRDITSILDIDDLLTRVVDLIQDAFGYYHVQVFLLDRDAGQLILRADGRTLSSEYRCLEMSQPSINARAAQSGKPVLVNDVARDPIYLFDGNLPGTRSELVVPLRLGDQVIGTLDVHHARIDAFSAEDVLVIQSLGDQIAVAIENAHLYDQSRELAILEERTRLARELHDSVTQSLYSVVLLSEGWRRQLSAGAVGTQPETQLRRISEIAQQALKEMRLLIHELRPPALGQDSLVDALRKRLDAVENHVGVEGRVVMDDFVDLPPDVEEGLYRIAQEALNNALKHAEATRETVRLHVQEAAVVLEISDDGRGFNLATAEKKGGMGLANMRERARQLGGELVIRSSPGAGTTVIVSVPPRGTNTPREG